MDNGTMKIFLKIMAVCAALVLGAGETTANDTAGTLLPTGRVVFAKQDGVQMRVEALHIKPGQIEVNYLFENITDKDITTQVFFPTPGQALSNKYVPDEFGPSFHDFDFKLWIDGKEKPYDTALTIHRLFYYNDAGFYVDEKTDVTEQLMPYLKPFIRGNDIIFPEGFDAFIESLPAETRDRWQREKLVEFYKHEEKSWWGKSLGKGLTFYWTQIFPVGKTVWVRHTYAPTGRSNSIGALEANCFRDYDEDKFFQALAKQHGVPVPNQNGDIRWRAYDYLQYILKTANNWSGPIESFNLLIEANRAAFACFEGKPLPVIDRFAAVNRQHFAPSADLELDFINKGAEDYVPAPSPAYALYRVDGPANVRETPGKGKVIGSLKDKTYAWAAPDPLNKDWYLVLQNDISGYTHEGNLRAALISQ